MMREDLTGTDVMGRLCPYLKHITTMLCLTNEADNVTANWLSLILPTRKLTQHLVQPL